MTQTQLENITTSAPSSIPVRPAWLTPAARSLMALFVAHALLDCASGMWPIFKKLAALDLSMAGLIASVTMFVGSVAQPLFGLWADRGHRRTMIVWGTALSCAAWACGPLGYHVDSLPGWLAYGSMFVLMLLSRVGQGMFHPAGASIAGNLMQQRRSTGVALFICAGFVGFALSQWLFSSVYLATAGHTELLLLLGFVLTVGVTLWCRPPEPGSKITSLGQAWADLKPVRLRLLVLFVAMVMLSALQLGFLFLMPEFIELRGYSPAMVNGGGFACFVAGSTVTMLPMGYLADRFGHQRMLITTLTLSIASYFTLVSIPSGPTWLFALLCFLSGGFHGATNPLGITLAQRMAPGQQSVISGVVMGLAWSLSSASPSLVAFLAEQPSLGILGALKCLGLAPTAALVLMVILPKARIDH